MKEAQNGGSGVVIYFRKEGRALGEVTKYLVYNARKRGTDKASEYFKVSLSKDTYKRSYTDGRLPSSTAYGEYSWCERHAISGTHARYSSLARHQEDRPHA